MILLDIDKAVSIIKNTQEDSEVVPNLMIGFGIDEAQAEYIAEIRLRALNRELVLKRLAEVEELRAEIERLSGILSSESKLTALIVQQLKEVRDRYGAPGAPKSCMRIRRFPTSQSPWRTTPWWSSSAGRAI